MLPASRSLRGITFEEEIIFAHTCSRVLLGSETLRIVFPDDTLFDALRDQLTAPAMVAMRTERGLLDHVANVEKYAEECDARRFADVAAHGLKTCFYPPCGKEESTVLQFRSYSACRSARYCSAEHGALHWKGHKPICRATVTAKHAAAAEDTDAARGKE